MIELNQNKSQWKDLTFARPKDMPEALKICNETGRVFLILALLQSIVGLFLVGLPSIVDGLVLAFCGLLIQRKQSRIGAILAVVHVSAVLCITGYNIMNPSKAVGGNNILLAVIMIFTAIRSTQATFSYHKFKRTEAPSMPDIERPS